MPSVMRSIKMIDLPSVEVKYTLFFSRGGVMPVGDKQPLRFGPFELDPQCGQLRKNGVGLKVQGQPVQILEFLLEKPGQLVTREELRQRLWASNTFVDFDHSLNSAVKKLRQALGDEADMPRYIETLPKRGYRFIGEIVRDGTKEELKADTEQTAGVAVLPLGQLEPRPTRRVRRWRVALIGPALVVLAITSAVVYAALKPEPQPRIVGAHVLTKTGNPKSYDRPLVDRDFIYFQEQQPSGSVTLAVPASGGEVSAAPAVNGLLIDVSRDGSRLLSVMYDPKRKQQDVWTKSLPTGSPRLVVQDACVALWTAGDSLFFVRCKQDNQDLYRANGDGTSVQRLATIPIASDFHVSADGAHIRFTEDTGPFALWEIGADGQNLHKLLGGDAFGGSWSPDGKFYFFMGWDGERWSLRAISETHHWWKWKRDEHSRPQSLTFGPLSIGVPAISNDGGQLYAVGKEPRGELSVYDSKAGKFVPYLGGISICYVDFSRDGKWIAYVSYPEGTLWRSRIDGSERRQLTVPPLGVQNPRWSPDGKLIAFTDLSNGDRRQMNDDSPHRIYVISADGGAPELLLAGEFGDPTWSPDGNSIAYAYRTKLSHLEGSEVRILDLKTQKSTTVPGSQNMWSPRWSPDGRYLVALLSWPPKKLMLYSFASNAWEELASGYAGWQCWSRDSKFVYAQTDDWVVRIAVSDHKTQQIASLLGFPATAYFEDKWNNGWFGLTPDSRPLTTRDTGIEELYAFDLEYK